MRLALKKNGNFLNDDNRQRIKWFSILLSTTLSLKGYSQNYTTVKIDSISIKIPGEGWNLIKRNPDGAQFMFQNQVTKLAISISARNKTKFEFHKPNLTDFELLSAFYRWDADYWKATKEYEVTEVEKNEEKMYIIWRIKSSQTENYCLYGLKSNYLIGLNVPRQKIESINLIQLLKDTFLD